MTPVSLPSSPPSPPPTSQLPPPLPLLPGLHSERGRTPILTSRAKRRILFFKESLSWGKVVLEVGIPSAECLALPQCLVQFVCQSNE